MLLGYIEQLQTMQAVSCLKNGCSFWKLFPAAILMTGHLKVVTTLHTHRQKQTDACTLALYHKDWHEVNTTRTSYDLHDLLMTNECSNYPSAELDSAQQPYSEHIRSHALSTSRQIHRAISRSTCPYTFGRVASPSDFARTCIQ